MIDSCKPRKLDPGFAQTYSNPSDFKTSTMKSPPGRSAVNTSTTGEGVPDSASRAAAEGALARAGLASCARLCLGLTTSAAAPVAAAPFKKLRRFGRLMSPPSREYISRAEPLLRHHVARVPEI